MSGQFISSPKSEEGWDGQEPEQPIGPEVAEQPTDEQPEHDKPPTESQDIPPGQEIEDAGAHASLEPDLEAELQELAKPETGGKRGDGSNVKGEILSNIEPVKIPEAGEGPPQL